MIVNETMSGISSLNSFSGGLGWLLTAGIFLAIILLIFLLSKNIRHFVYGSVITGILFGVYKLSRYISVEFTANNNSTPINWLIYITIFILVSIVIGKLLSKTKIIKSIERHLLDREE